MNLVFIETFIAAADEKSIQAAAAKVHTTPQNASSRVRTLEEELGFELIDRRERTFKLTRAGERFLHDARRLMSLWHDIKPPYGSNSETPESFRIGVIESVASTWLVPWLGELRRERPNIELQLSVDTSRDLHARLQRGDIDFAIAAEPVFEEGIRSHQLPPMPFVFVANAAQYTAASYTLQEIARAELLTFQRGSQVFSKLLDLLLKHDIRGAKVHAISSVSAMLRLVAGGFGIATLPVACVPETEGNSAWKVLTCTAALEWLPVHISWREDASLKTIHTIASHAIGFATREERD